MSSEELKPCPFCGGDVQFHKDDECSGCHYIQCGGCRAFFDFATSADPENNCESVDGLRASIAPMWNRRAETAALAAECERLRQQVAALSAHQSAQHPDDAAVDRFAAAMKSKLAKSREKGRHGWQAASAAHLSSLLYRHMYKADPLDVANLAMMLHQNGQAIELPLEARTPAEQQSAPERVSVPAELVQQLVECDHCPTSGGCVGVCMKAQQPIEGNDDE